MQEILTSGKPRPDPKPEDKPAGTRFWKKKILNSLPELNPNPKYKTQKPKWLLMKNPTRHETQESSTRYSTKVYATYSTFWHVTNRQVFQF